VCIFQQVEKDVVAAIAAKAVKQKSREKELATPLGDSRLERERVENLKVFRLKHKQFLATESRVKVSS